MKNNNNQFKKILIYDKKYVFIKIPTVSCLLYFPLLKRKLHESREFLLVYLLYSDILPVSRSVPDTQAMLS